MISNGNFRLVCLLLFLALSCSDKKTVYFNLDITESRDFPLPNWYAESHAVVIVNPPKDRMILEKQTIEYVKYNIGIQDVKFFTTRIYFYKESF